MGPAVQDGGAGGCGLCLTGSGLLVCLVVFAGGGLWMIGLGRIGRCLDSGRALGILRDDSLFEVLGPWLGVWVLSGLAGDSFLGFPVGTDCQVGGWYGVRGLRSGTYGCAV